jgi:flavin-dependent dehydrogenase
VHIFAGERYGPGFFAWIIPIGGDRYRIGWGFGRPDIRADPLQALIKDHPEIFEGLEILSQTGGLIPVGARSRMSGTRGLVVGDAAGQAKATSGGGLYTSLVSARHCADAAMAALAADDTSAERLSAYDKSWRTGIGRELTQATALRTAYRRLTDRELEWALKMLRVPGMRQVIDRYGDIDFPSRLAANALRFGPGLLRFLNGEISSFDALGSPPEME